MWRFVPPRNPGHLRRQKGQTLSQRRRRPRGLRQRGAGDELCAPALVAETSTEIWAEGPRIAGVAFTASTAAAPTHEVGIISLSAGHTLDAQCGVFNPVRVLAAKGNCQDSAVGEGQDLSQPAEGSAADGPDPRVHQRCIMRGDALVPGRRALAVGESCTHQCTRERRTAAVEDPALL